MLAGKGSHGVGARCGAVGRSNRRSIELGNLEQVLASPQLALEFAELFDGLVDFSGLYHGGPGLLIEFLSHTVSLISQAERRKRVRGQFAQLPALYPARTKRNAAMRSRNVLSYSPMR